MIEHFMYQTLTNALRHTTSPPVLLKLLFFLRDVQKKKLLKTLSKGKETNCGKPISIISIIVNFKIYSVAGIKQV